jgi:hypothetical protein
MSQPTNTVAEAIAAVEQNQLSSMYTKEDVLKLLKGIEQPSTDLESLFDNIYEAISNQLDQADSDSLVDYDSASFELSHSGYGTRGATTIQLECIEANLDGILTLIGDAMRPVFTKLTKPSTTSI